MTSEGRDWLEIWRPSPEAPGYEASSMGRVRGPGGIILRTTPQRSGHLVVSVKLNGRWTTRQVGAVVCAAFHGPRPPGKEADHRNRQRQENVPGNLRWLPAPMNKAIAQHRRGESRTGAKLSQAQVDEIRTVHRPHDRRGCSARALGKRFKVSTQTILSIISRHRWDPNRPHQLQALRDSLT